MSKDIVEILRGYAYGLHVRHNETGADVADMAADEIERLRNQVAVAKDIVNAGVDLMTHEQVGEWRGVRSFLEQEACDYDPAPNANVKGAAQ